ncbi:MAG: PD40 domain-containing protein, partial [Anaerolineales bacterium]|nr:PD40 domain-containing protein [Anaerolineales bacterium]
ILDSPQEVMWSSDGQWLLMGIYWGVDNSNLYYLVSSDGTFVANLEELTSTSHFRVQGPKPAFSPDGQKLAFVGIETDGEPWNGQPWSPEKLDHEEAYNLYVLDLNTLEYELVSSRFGVIQWASDGNGLYILDGTAITVLGYLKYLDSGAGVRYADLYYIDLTQETYPEQKLADDIPVNIPYGVWAYSPEAQAMAGIFYLERPVFGILFLK